MKVFNLIIKEGRKISYLENVYLVKTIKNGNMNGLIDWIDKKNDKFYKIAYTYLYNHHDIEDAFQNTIVKVYENIYKLKKVKYFETWFISILLNECRQTLRSKKREVSMEKNEIIPVEGFKFDYELKEALDGLDEKHRDVIILKYISGYKEEEIAEILEIKVGTVKSRTYRALDSLRLNLGEDYYE